MRLSTLKILCCPLDHLPLTLKSVSKSCGDNIELGQLSCEFGHLYPIQDSIAHLLRLESGGSEESCCPKTRKRAVEADWHDRQVQEQDTEMPVDEAHLFSWLTYYQLFEIMPFFKQLAPASILAVMCGLGFEFDILSRLTPNVWGMDISTGALKIALKRLCRLMLQGDLVVADVEQIPFNDDSFDMAVVHHSLHHMPSLEQPLSEMLRVSRKWVALFEPVDSPARRLSKQFRFSPAVEPGGTVVRDIHEKELATLVAQYGASVCRADRVLFPKTRGSHPTAIYAFLDQLRIPRILSLPLRSFNAILGKRLGTKGTFVVQKDQETRN